MSLKEPDLRDRLIERLRQLPQKQLPYIQDVMSHLERGGSTPLWIPATDRSTANADAELCRNRRFAMPPVASESSNVTPLRSIDWPHAPVHRISEKGTYLVTAGTLHKQHCFQSVDRLDLLEGKLLELAMQYGWHLEAWAVFSNHYHFVGHSGANSGDLNTFLSHLHSVTATEINRMDSATQRQVWHNFWDTRLTFEKSYLARLNYVHQNAVKHGLVRVANQYPWCSAAWFERSATPAQVKTIYSIKMDRVHVFDDFEVWPL